MLSVWFEKMVNFIDTEQRRKVVSMQTRKIRDPYEFFCFSGYRMTKNYRCQPFGFGALVNANDNQRDVANVRLLTEDYMIEKFLLP